MAEQGTKYPSQISGGQKQRVAVARALVTNAKLVLADEPTANLDRATANRIIQLMKKMRDEFGTTFIFSTHDPKVVKNAETIFTIEDGTLQKQSPNEGTVHV
jgi:putative ABC transport system ATP-binding protein